MNDMEIGEASLKNPTVKGVAGSTQRFLLDLHALDQVILHGNETGLVVDVTKQGKSLDGFMPMLKVDLNEDFQSIALTLIDIEHVA